ncbi:hypothetical protein GCQ56_00660 [Marinifilum sp. N1E240]|uniref:hypothetical protein n=1 Tax=Marinifilum sp. N1E240 TaxID=2608082 RepID=UPI00128B03DF|nr:hypothetical protein [Marinifilum sp. N1E240]MPQ45503.1 hypothetical protein [Marinifilum sp. N1E240]
MKKYTFISTVLIALFSLIFVSCDNNDEDFVPEKQTVSIKWDKWKTQVKSGDNDDDLLPDIPILTGKASNSDGSAAIEVSVELQSLPNFTLKDQSVTDLEGNFIFYDVAKGAYQIVVKQHGEVVGTSELLIE